MNQLISSNKPVTMSSLELVEYINDLRSSNGESILRHSDFLSKVPKVLNGGERNFSSAYFDMQGKERKCYLFPKREACLMAMSYSYELQAKIFDKMSELEEQQAPQIPKNFSEALQLAADQAKQLELAAPKVAFVDKLVDRTALMNATQVGQKHKLSAVKLNRVLVELNVYSKSVKRSKVFQQWFIDKGFGEMKQTEMGYPQALFTNAGEVWINEQLISEGVI